MTAPRTPKPTLKPGAPGTPITDADDFGEQTYARALKAVTSALSDVEKKVVPPGPKRLPKLSKRRRPPSRSK